MTRTFHPSKAYNLKPWRAEKTQFVNALVRGGYSLKEIAKIMGVSHMTVSRYYYGFADNCLPPSGKGVFSWSRDPRSVVYFGTSVAI